MNYLKKKRERNVLSYWSSRDRRIMQQDERETQLGKDNLKFLTSTIKSSVAPTDCSRFNAIQNTYSELWITRYVDRVRSEIIGRLPFAERSRAIWLKALYSWVHSLYGNQLKRDSSLRYLRIPGPGGALYFRNCRWVAFKICFIARKVTARFFFCQRLTYMFLPFFR